MPLTEPKTRVQTIRRGTLYGAAVGLLGGLLHVGVIGAEEIAAIAVWRNWILGGACVGLLIGTLRAVVFKSNDDGDNDV